MLNSPLCVNFLLNHAVGLPICGLRRPHLWELSSYIAFGPLDHWSRVKLPLIKCFSGSVDPAGLLLRLRSRRGVGWSWSLVLYLAHVNMNGENDDKPLDLGVSDFQTNPNDLTWDFLALETPTSNPRRLPVKSTKIHWKEPHMLNIFGFTMVHQEGQKKSINIRIHLFVSWRRCNFLLVQ